MPTPSTHPGWRATFGFGGRLVGIASVLCPHSNLIAEGRHADGKSEIGSRVALHQVKRPGRSPSTHAAYEDEARLSAFRELVYRLRTEAGLTQLGLAEKMGTTQSAIARMEGGGTQPTLQTLEKLASAVGAELVVAIGENLSANRSIAKLLRDGHAVIRHAS